MTWTRRGLPGLVGLLAMGFVAGCAAERKPEPVAVSDLIVSEENREMPTMQQGVPVHVTESGFVELVKQADKPILLDAYADWCGPCRMLAPELETVAREAADEVIVAKLDVDKAQQLAGQLGVRSIPAMFLIKDGMVVEQWVGYADSDTLLERLRPHLGDSA